MGSRGDGGDARYPGNYLANLNQQESALYAMRTLSDSSFRGSYSTSLLSSCFIMFSRKPESSSSFSAPGPRFEKDAMSSSRFPGASASSDKESFY